MLELILKGRPRFYLWLCFLGAIIGLAFVVYLFQLNMGLTLTGLSRDVSWGLYIAQLTYFVGVAAGAVCSFCLPTSNHMRSSSGSSSSANSWPWAPCSCACCSFVVDLGQPQRMLNVMLHPTPNSILFWDMLVLCVYLVLNLIIGWVTLEAARNDVMPPKWIKVLIYISIIWAFSIHTVTGFLYAGVPGRHYWLTAIMAARFLASAFCSGPAILLLLLMIVRRVTGFEPGREATKTLSTIITYAMCVNVFFYLLELFTAFYSGIPGHQHSILYLFVGHDGHMAWINSWMWTAVVFAALSLLMLIPPALRYNDKILPWALVLLVIASWIDKSLGLLIGGFVPNMFETVTEYTPTIPEIVTTIGVYAIGALVVSLFWKIAIDVKKENGTFALKGN